MENNKRKDTLAVVVAVAISTAGIATAAFTVAWLAAFLKISVDAANKIAWAIDTGGWALVAIGFLFAGGLGGAVFATVKAVAARKTRAVFIL